MIFSVFNWNSLQYDYYRADAGPAPGEPIRPRRRYQGGESVRPEDILPLLPVDAIKVGSGIEARGRLAVVDATSFEGFGQEPQQESSWFTPLLVVGAAYVAIKLLIAGAKSVG